MLLTFGILAWMQVSDSLAATQESKTWEMMMVWEKGSIPSESISAQLTEEERRMLEQMSSLPKENSAHVIHRFEGKYYGFNNCSLELFQWDGAAWQPFAGIVQTGTSCSNDVFFKDGEIYSFGGIGYWQAHSDLFRFASGGSLEFIPTENQPKNFYGSLNFQTEAGLYSLFGGLWDMRTGQQEISWGGHYLDFQTKKWSPVQFDFNEEFKEFYGESSFQKDWVLGGVFETPDYAGIEIGTPKQKCSWLIVDKRDAKLYVKGFNQCFLAGPPLRWLLQSGNTLRVLPEYDLTPIEFDLDEIVASAIPVGRLGIGEASFFSTDWHSVFDSVTIALLVLVVLVFLGVWRSVLSLKTPPKLAIEAEEPLSWEVNGWIRKLKSHVGTVISQEVMDELLGIEHQKNPDIRKVNRSRAIRALNEQAAKEVGWPIITRERDTGDKRIIRYRISPLAKPKIGSVSEKEGAEGLGR